MTLVTIRFGREKGTLLFLFYETIRDVAANYADAVDEGTIQQRIVLHETVHRFLGPHGAPGADERVMHVPTLVTGTAQENELSPRQIRLIQENSYPTSH